MKSDDNVVINNGGIGFVGICYILFWNFGTSSVDLYDAIIHSLFASFLKVSKELFLFFEFSI